MRRLVLTSAFALLALAPGSAAGSGPTYLMQGWTGVTAPGVPVRYVTLAAGSETVLAVIRRSTGRVLSWRPLHGTWGVPLVAQDGATGGLSRDGKTLVLGEQHPIGTTGASRFLLLDTGTLRVRRRIALPGDFSFDALSPGGGTLFLIQHVAGSDVTSYRVRAYDVVRGRLLPRVIADRRQASWVMHGTPVARATSADGRWVYTLYQQPDGYPFVHALDAVRRSAVCVGIPWQGSQDSLWATVLSLDRGGKTLTLSTHRGRPLFTMDTTTFVVARVRRHPGGGFPLALVLGAAGGAAALAALALALRRRLRLAALRSLRPALRLP
jgi:hypothetical protein